MSNLTSAHGVATAAASQAASVERLHVLDGELTVAAAGFDRSRPCCAAGLAVLEQAGSPLKWSKKAL
jgi:hypothetical protein